MLQAKTIPPDTVEKLNCLIKVDQNIFLDSDKFSQLTKNLKSKINLLKDSITVSLPKKFSDLSQDDFLVFSAKIDSLNKKLELIKHKENQIRNSIDNFKMEIRIKNEDYFKTESLKQSIYNSINLNRHQDYCQILIIFKSYKIEILEKLKSFDEIKIKENFFKNSRKKQSNNLDHELNIFTKKSEILKSLLKSNEKLKEIYHFSFETKCNNLNSFIIDSLASIQEYLRKIFKLELETVLKQLKYPQEKYDINRKEDLDIVKNVHDYVSYLLIIDTPFLGKKNVTIQSSVIEILVKPFEKRFKFHFLTNRKTNDINKV